ncbi:LysE/ArgO family amino acid transporter [Uliginosibacterium sp. 31-16]|uniref:LysE/ArgO family amino acid transporter n=1 Tax=Uliginosibacterium sp. 31-16 TaxID=3068315 RepID=UPI00273E5CE7|nr:LysE/ArgO family amino acid transporter [Uliginosibacterium sp. 31-16]MDP5239572.1 LysE/ArgO family amino acid transporter [Uliginosibacterium sp. 31-16]
MNSFIQGFTVSGGLILAIGAQNAHVLKMGLTRQHVLPTVLICAISDALLIGLGIGGMGALLDQWPQAVRLATWAGAAFLFWYSLSSLRAAFTRRSLQTAGDTPRTSLRAAVLMILAFTYLNPHTYLDTVVLIGSIGAHLANGERLIFWLGCITASATWFTLLGFGAHKLSPLFAKPQSWRVLDALVGVGMGALAFNLVH